MGKIQIFLEETYVALTITTTKTKISFNHLWRITFASDLYFMIINYVCESEIDVTIDRSSHDQGCRLSVHYII